jgi:hypothetical protein
MTQPHPTTVEKDEKRFTAGQYLEGILTRWEEIHNLQDEINELVIKARDSEDYEGFEEAIESYYE